MASDLLEEVGLQGALDVGAALQSDASSYTNSGDVEALWAIKTYRHAEVYMKLISSMDPKNLKLTKFDEIIYRNFKRYFKTLEVEVLDMQDFKSEQSKAAWRPFCQQFKGKIEDYNYGTLLRIDCKKDYSEENTFVVTRIQFYAIELARNKRGLNTFHLKDAAETPKGTTKEEENNNNNNKENEISQKMDTLNTNDSDVTER